MRMTAAVCLFVLIAGSACDVIQPSPHRLSLTNSDNGRTVAIRADEGVDITLQTVGPGEYSTPAVSSDALRFTGVSLVNPPNPAGPRQLFKFDAVHQGQATITITHTERPSSFKVTVNVQ